MQNRFFDVNKNVYLNSLYVLTMLSHLENSIELERLLIGFYFMKYPKVLIDLAEKNMIGINAECFQEYDLDNIESNMLKFSMRIHTDGLYDALAYLCSKDIISYLEPCECIVKSTQFEKVDFASVPQYLISASQEVMSVVKNIETIKLKQSINEMERVYYE